MDVRLAILISLAFFGLSCHQFCANPFTLVRDLFDDYVQNFLKYVGRCCVTFRHEQLQQLLIQPTRVRLLNDLDAWGMGHLAQFFTSNIAIMHMQQLVDSMFGSLYNAWISEHPLLLDVCDGQYLLLECRQRPSHVFPWWNCLLSDLSDRVIFFVFNLSS